MEDTADLEQLLLAPLPGNSPAGEDLRWDEAFTLIKEARRTDDPGDLWPGSKQKVADWQEVRRLCTEALATRSKDLQLAAWLAEALVHDRGFEGMASGLGLIYALMDRYWDVVYPLPEDGDLEMRAGVLEFIDIRLSDAARQVPLTEYDADGGHSVPSRSFSLLDRMTMAAAGTVDDFNAAVEYTSTPHLQGLSANFRDVRLALENLKAVANRLLADLAPRFEKLEAALAECRRLVQWSLTLRGQPEFPVEAPPAEVSGPVPAPLAPETVSLSPEPAAAPSGPSPLERAEELVRAGHLQEALTELAAATAANETGGDRFRRKLLVADVCMRTRRTNLAIAVLEELSAEIDHFHLDQWESPQLVGRVWSQLLECYFSSNMESHVDQIRPLLARLCRLDPTQALDFESYMGRYAIRTPAS